MQDTANIPSPGSAQYSAGSYGSLRGKTPYKGSSETSAQDTSCSCGSADQGRAGGDHGAYQDVYHQGGYQNQSGMFQGPPNYGPAPYGVGANPGYQYGPMPGQWIPGYPPPGFQQVHPGMYGPQEMGQPFVHPQQFPGGHAQSIGYYQPYSFGIFGKEAHDEAKEHTEHTEP